MSDVSDDSASKPPATKRPRQYVETGEPDNKLFTTLMVIMAVLVLAGFAYFMIFKFHDVFFETAVVQK